MKVCCPNHAKTKHLQRVLSMRLKRPFRLWEAIGIVECLFQFAANSADDGRVGRYDNDVIACWFEWFPDENADHHDLIGALVEVGYLDEIDGNDRLEVHDWTDHAPKYIQDRLSKRKSRKLSKLVETCPELSEEIAINPTKPNPTKPIKENTITLDRVISVLEGPKLFDPYELVDKWNQQVGVAKVRVRKDRALSPARTKAFGMRCKEDPNWYQSALNALDKFPLPCWADGSFKPNFDWFCRQGQVEKILEGQFDWGKDYNPPPVHKVVSVEQQQLVDERASLHALIQAYRKDGNGASDECDALKRKLALVEEQIK